MPAADAAERLRHFGYAAVGDYARLDVSRAARKGVPEVVYAAGKTSEQLVAIAGRVPAARPGRALQPREPGAGRGARPRRRGGRRRTTSAATSATVRRAGVAPAPVRGAVGVLAAGTSDLGAAGEAVAMCRAMDVLVVSGFDVGVAGLHRLSAPLEEMRAAGVAAIVVAAGMEGALPSVVAGLVDVPVIGLPTSTGYGLGGKGEAALLGMLQSCSPGLVVVNIDNGIGAGATAALIARRASA